MPPPKFHGLITIDSTNDVFTITGAVTGIARTITLTQGDYFIRGYTGEGSNQLVEHIQAQIRAAAGIEFDAFVVSVSDDGFVTFSNLPNEAFTVTGAEWFPGSGGLARLLGFTGDLSPAATSFTGANQHRFGWYPNVVRNDMTGHPSTTAPLESDAVVTVAPNGTGTTTKYNERSGRTITIGNVFEDYVHPVGSPLIVSRDYRQFWQDILSTGRRFRYYDDRTVQAGPGGTGAPETFFADKETARDGTWRGGSVKRESADWARLWRVEIDARTYV